MNKKLTRHTHTGKKENAMAHILILILFVATQSAHAQEPKVRVKLTQPPPNRLAVKDLWNLTVTNTSKSEIKITLEGTVDEAKDGRIVEGATGVFTLKANEAKRLTADNIPGGGTYTWSNNRYKEAILRTGSAPSGSYTICIYAKSETGQQLAMDCIQHNIEMMSPPTLVSPADGETIPEGQSLTFTWLPPMPTPREAKYTLKIVEVIGNQTPDEAMKRNPAWFEKGDIRTTTFQYPTSARKLETGKKYAWQVTAFSSGDKLGASYVWSFTAVTQYIATIDSAKVECGVSAVNCYNFTVWVRNANMPDASQGITNVGEVFNFEVEPSGGNVSISSPSMLPQDLLYNHTMTIVGTVCYTTPVVPPLKFRAYIRDKTNPSDHKAFTTRFVNELPSCTCCANSTHRVDSLIITSTRPGSGLVQLAGRLYAGPKPITKVSAELVYFSVRLNDPYCTKCNSNNMHFGNITFGTLGDFGAGVITTPSGAPQYSREITWTNASGVGMTSGKPLIINLALPPAKTLSCCSDTLRFCIRYSFTDTNCVTCDTLICVSVILDQSGARLGMRDAGEEDWRFGALRNIAQSASETKAIDSSHGVGEYAGDPFHFACAGSFFAVPLLIYGFSRRRRQISTRAPLHFMPGSRELFFIFTLSLMLIPPVSIVRAQTNVTVRITADNAYVFGFGDKYGITDYRSPGVANKLAGEIYDAVIGTETYSITASLDGYIYIAAWSDERDFQGVIAEFTDGSKTIRTGPILPGNAPQWQVYATGSNLDDATNDPAPAPPDFTPRGNNNAPVLGPVGSPNPTFLNGQIGIANANAGNPINTSVGWVATTTQAGMKGVLVFGPNNLACGYTSQNQCFPPGTVDGIDQSTRWMWYNPNPASIPNVFARNAVTNSAVSKEYYIFRIGPIGELLAGDQIGCCSDFTTSVSSTVAPSTTPGRYTVNTTFNAGTKKIKKVTASLIHFSQTHTNTDCQRCANSIISFGSFVTATHIFTTPVFKSTLTNPFHIDPLRESVREIIWSDPAGGSSFLQDKATTISVKLPDPSSLECCSDTLRFCIRYKFTDTACVTCDTLICYEVIQKGRKPGGTGDGGDTYDPNSNQPMVLPKDTTMTSIPTWNGMSVDALEVFKNAVRDLAISGFEPDYTTAELFTDPETSSWEYTVKVKQASVKTLMTQDEVDQTRISDTFVPAMMMVQYDARSQNGIRFPQIIFQGINSAVLPTKSGGTIEAKGLFGWGPWHTINFVCGTRWTCPKVGNPKERKATYVNQIKHKYDKKGNITETKYRTVFECCGC